MLRQPSFPSSCQWLVLVMWGGASGPGWRSWPHGRERTHRLWAVLWEGCGVGGTKRRPYGSTAKTRQMVLAALGVVKVATAEQIRQLMCPGTAGAQTVRNGCLDLGRDGLVESLGSASRTNAAGNLVSEKLWNLTGPGLEAAAAVLDRPVREMGGTARGAARSGAKHAVKVTDTITAFLQTPPEPTRPVPRKAAQPATTALSSAPAGNGTPLPCGCPERPQGLGRIGSWATEVVLPVSGTLSTPGKNSPRADAVLTAPEDGVPVMFVEVDNGTESPIALSYKASRYREFFRRTVKPPSPSPDPYARTTEPVPMWESLYGPLGREGYPPLAVVFTKQVGPTAMNNRINSVMRLTEEHWAGHYQVSGSYGSDERDGYTDYTDAVPILVTTLDRLREHGPLGPVWFVPLRPPHLADPHRRPGQPRRRARLRPPPTSARPDPRAAAREGGASSASASARKRGSDGRRRRPPPKPPGSPTRCARNATGRWRAAASSTTRGKRTRRRPTERTARAAASSWPSPPAASAG